MVTARDVARLAGTSTAVVSYVFNNGPRGVSDRTRQKVLDAAAELDYRPNVVARALSAGRTRSVGLIVPDICNPYFAELARALEDAASATGNLLLIADSALSTEQEARHRRSLLERQVDSVVLISMSEEPDFAEFAHRNVPVVALHPVHEDAPASSLTIDYVAAARAATEHLLGHGYKDVRLLNGPTDSAGSLQHRRGFEAAVAAAGRSIDIDVWRSNISRHSAAEAVSAHLSRGDRPRAVYCSTDEQAFGVLYAAHATGLRVPDDLAVIGFDGTRNCEVSIPSLSTVQQPLTQYAGRALEILTRPDAAKQPVREVLPHVFVVRRSCGAHPEDER
jgi:LacI family transcriptional regulator